MSNFTEIVGKVRLPLINFIKHHNFLLPRSSKMSNSTIKPYYDEVFTRDIYSTARCRDVSIHDLYFHGEYEQFLTLIVSRCGLVYIEYEFAVIREDNTQMEPCTRAKNCANIAPQQPSSTSVAAGEETKVQKVRVDYSRMVNERITHNGGSYNNYNGRNHRQSEMNKYWQQKAYKVEITDSWQRMNVYDITSKQRSLIFNFEGHNRYEVSCCYAFTSDGKYYSYIEEWEDGDMRNEPEVYILRMWTYSELRWNRKRDMMMFLAGYDLLRFFKKGQNTIQNAPDTESSIPTEEIKKLTLDCDQSQQKLIEPPSVEALFKVLHCPNLLQHIVGFL